MNTFYAFDAEYRGRFENNPTSKCLIPFRAYDCLLPEPGYNRDLVISSYVFKSAPLYQLSEFEGSTEEAIELRKDRAKFTDNLGINDLISLDWSLSSEERSSSLRT